MKRCLILLTTGYPYNGAEPYLDAELPTLVTRFERILLLPIGIAPGATSHAPIPAKVTLYNSAVLSAKRGRLSDVLHGLPTILRLPDMPEGDKKEVGRSPLRRAFLGYFRERTHRHIREIENTLKREDFSEYDEVVLYSYWLFATASVAMGLRPFLQKKGAKSIRFLSRAHSYDIYTYANRLHYLPCRHEILESVDGVYVCSENGQKYLAERYPAYKDKIHLSYLGAEGGPLQKGSEDGVFRLLTCAHAIPLKRLDRLCDTLARPELRNLPIQWTHIGDGTELPALKKKVAELSLQDKVMFCGTLPHDTVLRHYRTSPVDLFVSLSSREGLPVSVMEALSFGVPAVCTDVGGCSEMIRDGENGYLLPRDFTDAELSELLRKAMTDAVRLRQEAFRTWETTFTAAQNFSAFSDALCGESE